MTEQNIEDLIKRLLKEGEGSPFPYDDVRKLQKTHGIDEGFIPDLDTYFYNIWSHSSSLQRLRKKEEAELQQYLVSLSQSFFEKHSEYAYLIPNIIEESTPALYARLERYEKLRVLTVKYISILLRNNLMRYSKS